MQGSAYFSNSAVPIFFESTHRKHPGLHAVL